MPPTTVARPIRRDAAANRERLLRAAARAVRRRGDAIAMTAIAAEAGVGIGTLYRHFPTRAALLAALTDRSYQLVLSHARRAVDSPAPVPEVIARFLSDAIAAREQLVLPLHGGPIDLSPGAIAARTEISDRLERVLARGRREGSVRADVSAIDLIITSVLLARPLPHVTDWDGHARRQAALYLAGLTGVEAAALPGRAPTRAALESGFRAQARAAP
ncbi:TetR/AcrR family transcriptional regulator [Conexibacter sp. DBS9H8]|uniref:TetR/AcrR family transcriptional regulator n=1 Tax=Conexibacter sp. DBS9H8 TaxID=2937801 RepID=UPI00200FEE02|nr:TetR/AcrR family transcriptional regulator [Conexibacter sp. DBS9H8]